MNSNGENITIKTYNKYIDKLEGGFRGRWIKHWRVSIMLAVLILVLGGFSAYRIPKESSPSISFGIISISTIYPGVNSVDIDNLITHKIEHAIEDINGVKKINSTSSIGISNVSVELYNDIDTKKTLQEIKDEISKINLPEDAEDPMVREISTNNEVMFQLVLYADQNKYPKNTLLEFSKSIIDTLEGTNGITSINIGGGFNDGLRGGSAIAEGYEIQIQIDKNKIQSLGLTLSQITTAIRNNNKNQPLGSYELGGLNYDFRIQGEYVSTTDIMNTTISNTAGYELKLKDIADYKLKYKDDSIVKYGSYKKSGYNSVSLVFNKKKGGNIFNSADEAKISINKLMSSAKYKDINYIYTLDLAEQIRDDYQNLGISGIQTLIIVFLCMLIFVSIKEAIIGALSIPLAFFITFMVLDYQGRTLNFMTNFSLILTLGIIIDLAIVIAEAAYNNMKLGYHAKTSVLMASRDFSIPLIAGTATTIVVFIPLLFLPGVTGKFLGYIPITVFSTLTAALCIGLTLSGVGFYLFNRHYKFYTPDKSKEKFLQKIDYEILMIERENKELKPFSQLNRKEQQLSYLEERYAKKLVTFLTNTTKRRTSIIVPIILLILSFIFLSPQIGFELFPKSDNNRVDFGINFKAGTATESTTKYISLIENKLVNHEYIKTFIITANDNKISIGIDLIDKSERSKSAFDIEKEILDNLQFMTSEGIKVESAVLAGGPPSSKPVALELIADDTNKFTLLKQISKDFEKELKTYTGTKNVTTSSPDTPGQFIFKFEQNKIGFLGLSQSELMGEIYNTLNGLYGGSIKINNEDIAIKVSYDNLEKNISPSTISDLIINTRVGPIRIGDFMNYEIDSSVGSILRKNGDITIRIDADLKDGFTNQGPVLQKKIEQRAKSYPFPAGIIYKSGGEQSDNADLIQTTIIGFFVALFAIYMILVLEFNSFSKPAIIMYSVILGLLGVNIGLYITGNPYSMAVGIGIIAMTGIVVDNAAIILERINDNTAHNIDTFEAIVEACKSRLQPMLLTSMTDFFGLLPIAFQDEFWQGLAFTISFGLFAGACMTLFVIPSLYYIVFTRRNNRYNNNHRGNNKTDNTSMETISI